MVTEGFFKVNIKENPILFLSPHHIAVFCGNLDSYKHFVDRTENINPNEPYEDITPMHFAAIYGNFEICQ